MNNLKDLEAMQVVVREFRSISLRNREIVLNMLKHEHEHEQIGEAADDPYYEIKKAYLAEGPEGRRDKIRAIKAVREASGRNLVTGYPILGLKESKDLVESW